MWSSKKMERGSSALPCKRRATNYPQYKIRHISPLLLVLSRSEVHLTLDSDGCDKQAGFILVEFQPNKATVPLSSSPKTHIPAKQSYNTARRDYLEVVRAVLLSPPYFLGDMCTVSTDHVALEWIFSLT